MNPSPEAIAAKLAFSSNRAERGYPIVEVDEWIHADDYATTGHVVRSRWKTVAEVRGELLCHLGAERPVDYDYVSDDCVTWNDEGGCFGAEGLSNFAGICNHHDESTLWPQGEIRCYAVRGSSEGDWVHVDVKDWNGKTECVLLAKTFRGRDAAWRLARALADLLGC